MSQIKLDKKMFFTWLGIIGIPLLVALIPVGDFYSGSKIIFCYYIIRHHVYGNWTL